MSVSVFRESCDPWSCGASQCMPDVDGLVALVLVKCRTYGLHTRRARTQSDGHTWQTPTPPFRHQGMPRHPPVSSCTTSVHAGPSWLGCCGLGASSCRCCCSCCGPLLLSFVDLPSDEKDLKKFQQEVWTECCMFQPHGREVYSEGLMMNIPIKIQIHFQRQILTATSQTKQYLASTIEYHQI